MDYVQYKSMTGDSATRDQTPFQNFEPTVTIWVSRSVAYPNDEGRATQTLKVPIRIDMPLPKAPHVIEK